MTKTRYLFPTYFKKIGWILFAIGVPLGLCFVFGILKDDFDFFRIKVFALADDNFLEGNGSAPGIITNNILNELIGIFIILGSFFIGFSKHKEEDEYIQQERLKSLTWATYINYGVLIIGLIFIYGLPFINVMIYSMFLTLILFVLRFQWMLSKAKRSLSHEE